MKKIVILLLSILIFTFCKNEKLPQCENISDVSLGNISKKHSKLEAIIHINNPDKDKSFTLKNVTLDLKINGRESGTMVSVTPREIMGGDNVSVPVSYLLNTEDFVNPDDINGDYNVDFKGTMTLKNISSGDLEEIPIHKNISVPINIKKIEKQEDKANKKESRKERKALKKQDKQ